MTFDRNLLNTLTIWSVSAISILGAVPGHGSRHHPAHVRAPHGSDRRKTAKANGLYNCLHRVHAVHNSILSLSKNLTFGCYGF